MKDRADIGVIGLAVMGENLALNMEGHGFTVAVHNRTVPGVEEGVVERFMAGRGKGRDFIGEPTLEGFVRALAPPRKVLMMIKAGTAVDELIGRLAPLLDRGDILIDGGNSHFADTVRRTKEAEARGLLYVGTGVSGGEEGALRGPSLMPGGSPAAWPAVRPIFLAIAAKAPDGTPCAGWVGPDGAGHFVKMVHNGIEYGDMQLIAESYGLMAGLLGMGAGEISEAFAAWNRGELESYLISITADILAFKDADGRPLVDRVLDAAGQKGTGKWASAAALDLGVPLTLISEAVFGRCLSAAKEARVGASKVLRGPGGRPGAVDRTAFLGDLEKALTAAKVVSYAQGFELLRAAAAEYGWRLDHGGIAMLWRGGCIIRSAFLGRIREAFDRDPQLANLLLDPFFRERIGEAEGAWRRVVAAAVTHGAWVPAMASGLSYLDGLRSARLPANLLQAQRDYFGAHGYERVDRPRGEFFHTDWTGRGGPTASGTYNV